jgi:hypothetical protein
MGDEAIATIGDECEAYLAGGLVEYLTSRGEDVPSWAWLNKLAHASPEEMEAIAMGTVAYGAAADYAAWNQSVTVLAADLLDQVHGDASALRAVQSQFLVPFELAAIDSGPAFPMTPSLLVSVGRAVLRRHPSVGF